MKFLYADSLDFVDPDYDFVNDRHGATRRMHADDDYAHEHLVKAPYDGILVSRAIVGGVYGGGKYTPAQAMRFHREGARAFLRYPKSRYPGSMVMGDCGAFSYRNAEKPPYTVDDTLEFYEDGGFTHGCSVDHVIFDFVESGRPSTSARKRFDITLSNAASFLKASRVLGRGFTPIGVIQGWSPASMANAGSRLAAMGYRYLAVGGMVPLRTAQIVRALEAIRLELPNSVKLHLLGFGKTEDLGVVSAFGVSSFDTTSPLRRAFKDAKKNYYALQKSGDIDYYTAIRIPQAIDNAKLLRRAKRGQLNQERLLRLEAGALDAVRSFGAGRSTVRDAVAQVLAYGRYALWDDRLADERNERRLTEFGREYTRTLNARVWESCPCRVCHEAGIETIIFRSSNRNKRRGIHNLYVVHSSVQARFNGNA